VKQEIYRNAAGVLMVPVEVEEIVAAFSALCLFTEGVERGKESN
jgi:hypothetical protein